MLARVRAESKRSFGSGVPHLSRNIEQTIREVMAVVLNLDAERISDDASMDNTPGWDSASHISLVLALEEEFSMSFEVAEIEMMTSYFDIINVVEAKL